MPRVLNQFGLPLLAKELLEQSARRRTFIIRTVYASLLFFTAYLLFYETLTAGITSPLATLGKGRELFVMLCCLQFMGIYFFMPAMTSGVITHEKERASLQLLFLTRLGPWTILFEKLASRVIPMLYFLLLSLPLLAFSYTLGGLTLPSLALGVWLLTLAVLQMGALALCCSAYCRTSVAAFIATYLLTLVMFLGPPLGWLLLWTITGFDINQLASFPTSRMELLAEFQMPLFGLGQFVSATETGLTTSYWPVAIHSVLVLFQCGICLILARVFLLKRAFVQPRNFLLRFFQRLDQVFARWNNNPMTRGIVLGGTESGLPDTEPVAWRETAKRSLGQTRYLARLFMGVELPMTALCVMLMFATTDFEWSLLLLLVVWIVAILVISVQAASLIAGERSHQTLDVLASTPLTAHEVIRQKIRSVWRLVAVMAIPFVTLFGFSAAMRWHMPDPRAQWLGYHPVDFDLAVYLTCSLLSIAVYLPLLAWLSFYIGLRMKTQARAIATSLATILGFCIGPLIFVMLPIEILFRPPFSSPWFFCNLLSPASIVALNESNEWHYYSNLPWVAMILNFTWYAGWTLFFRWLAYAQAERILGRLECPQTDRPGTDLPQTKSEFHLTSSPEYSQT
ncbi:MAG: hypothetical protein JSS02_23200 [Planctomycetes bacterium]|nr:hypothetical protein [Planctomycetota bacterium]